MSARLRGESTGLAARGQLTLHERIYRDLLDRIHRGEYAPGLFPTERELQDRYGTSRAPVRQALARLRDEGVLIRQPGRGSFVPDFRPTAGWARLSGFSDAYAAHRDRLQTRLIDTVTSPAPRQAVEHLGVEENTPLVRVRRLRLLDETPLMLFEHYLPPGFTPDELEAVAHYFSLRTFLADRFAIRVTEADEDVAAVAAEGEIAAALGIQPGRPLLQVTRRSWDHRRHPIDFTRYWVRDWSYRARLSSNR